MTATKRPAMNAIRALHETYWAMLPEKLQLLHEIAARQSPMSPEMVAREWGAKLEQSSSVTVRDGVARIPISGPLMRYANIFSMISGATSYELVARDLELAVRDPQVRAIVLDLDSPGGAVNGVFELAEQVRAADARKPIYGYASGDVASAAYLIASATRRLVVSPTSMVGSLGVCVSIEDKSAQREAMGIQTVTIVSSQSPRKNVDVTTPEGRGEVQRIVDDLAAVFMQTVARYRGVSVETVLADYGAGSVVVGAAALQAGLVDGVAYAEDFHAELAGTRAAPPRSLPPAVRPAPTLQQELVMKYSKDSKVRAAGAKAVSVQDGEEGTVEEVRDAGAFYRVAFPGGTYAWLAEDKLGEVGEGAPTEEEAAASEEEDEGGAGAPPAASSRPALVPAAPTAQPSVAQQAATAERARILAIQALALPGEETLMQTCLDDPECTPDMAARRFREAQGSTRTGRLDARRASEGGKPRATVPAESSPSAAPPPSKQVTRVLAAIQRVFPSAKQQP